VKQASKVFVFHIL